MSGGGTTMGSDRMILRPWRRIMVFSEAIKFEHSVFALPFAVVSALMAMEIRQDWASLGWVVLAMVAMRTFGMGSNRVIDAQIDARNPRTSGRALPAGLLSHREMWAYMAVSIVVFGLAVSRLEPLAWKLAVVPVLVMLGYPYLKRFTWLSHFGLGVIYLIVPPAAWIAVTGELPAGIIWMGAAAMMWVAGFDVLYATADLEVDKAQGLKSIPARFGIKAALMWGRALHASAVAAIVIAGVLLDAGPLYFAGAAAAAVLLAYENSLVSPTDLSRLNVAFFTMNGIIAVVFGVFASLDVLI